MIFIFLTEFPTDALEDATNYSPTKSVHTVTTEITLRFQSHR